MQTAYEELGKHFRKVAQIDHALTFLEWDQLVMMPPAGSDARARAIAELAVMRHDLLTAPQMADLLRAAGGQTSKADADADAAHARSLAEMERVWQRAACLSPELVKAKSLAGSRCENDWRTQRRENDWKGFLKNFREVVRLSREEARARQAAAPERFATPYDALLDLYCTGEDGGFIQRLFEELKGTLPDLLQRVLQHQPADPSGLEGRYPVEAQKGLSRELMTRLGFDFSAGRLDVSLHPFSTGCRGDQRITTRFRETDFLDALMATAHESGHAGYESGLPEAWEGLPAGRACNMSIHESQSLLFEKHVFLSRTFTTFFARSAHEFLPEAKRFPPDRIWAAGVRVRPGLIRIEADEVSYPLHVIMRFEIEKALVNQALEAAEIPEIWDDRMTAYLGLSTRDNYTDGCLQDIHWTHGDFGYFPSYTLGALNAAQLFAAIRRRHPEWRERFRKGDVAFVRRWLGDTVWRHGRLRTSGEIIRDATGEDTGPACFLDHLQSRYIDRRD